MNWIDETLDQKLFEARGRSKNQLAAIFAKTAKTGFKISGALNTAAHIASGKPVQIGRHFLRKGLAKFTGRKIVGTKFLGRS